MSELERRQEYATEEGWLKVEFMHQCSESSTFFLRIRSLGFVQNKVK